MENDWDVALFTSCGLSLGGTFFVIVNYMLRPDLKETSFKFIFHLSLANFLWALTVSVNITSI